jgi:hypothetical protein
MLRLAALVVGLVLLASFVAKMRRPSRFIDAVRGLLVVPKELARPVSFLVIAAEAATSALLLVGNRQAIGFRLASLLFTMFAVAELISVRAEGTGIDCGCLGELLRLRTSRVSIAVNAGVGGVCFVSALMLSLNLSTASSVGEGFKEKMAMWLVGSLGAFAYWLALYAGSVASAVPPRPLRGVSAE